MFIACVMNVVMNQYVFIQLSDGLVFVLEKHCQLYLNFVLFIEQ